MELNQLIDKFVAATSAKLITRTDELTAPNLPEDLRSFLQRFQGGYFYDFGNKFEIQPNLFEENLNIYHARHEALPRGGHLGAFRRYDSCYVLASSISSVVPTEADPEKLFVGVDLQRAHFGWVFYYCTGEHPWEIDNTACYIAESWSDYMTMVINSDSAFQGAPLWSREHRILSEDDLLDYYTPSV